jgi:multiple sugar transport system substrate-binding protein
VSGNWGGSTLAALKSTKFPVHAAELARWILAEPEPVNMFTFDRFLFPPLTSTLEDPEWLNAEYDFYGGQQVNKVYAEMNEAVGKDWVWSPIHEFVNSEGQDLQSKALERGQPLSGTLQPWQDAVVEYAQQQGIQVAGQ